MSDSCKAGSPALYGLVTLNHDDARASLKVQAGCATRNFGISTAPFEWFKLPSSVMELIDAVIFSHPGVIST